MVARSVVQCPKCGSTRTEDYLLFSYECLDCGDLFAPGRLTSVQRPAKPIAPPAVEIVFGGWFPQQVHGGMEA